MRRMGIAIATACAVVVATVAAMAAAAADRGTATATAAGPSPYCFGAAGDGCATGGQGGPAFCRSVLGSDALECMVHAGSIEHDTCCRANPGGRGCAAGQDTALACSFEHDKAKARTARGLYWTRHLDPRIANRGSEVDFDRVCAPRDTVVAAGDERHCCARAATASGELDQDGGARLRCR